MGIDATLGLPARESEIELAHVLFIDIVSFSKLPSDQQRDVVGELQELVHRLPEFAKASRRRHLTALPTGDGMLLAFFGDPVVPATCARQLAITLKSNSRFQVRMGLHTGPVYRVLDINANKNLAGGGVNLAQRVMDSGDAGHILASKAFSEILLQFGDWRSSVHDLGEVTVKHGEVVHLFNLFTEEFGNPETPSKVVSPNGDDGNRATRRDRRLRVRSLLFLASAVALVVAIAVWLIWRNKNSSPEPPPVAKDWYDKGTSALRQGTFQMAANALQMSIDKYGGFVLAHARLADAWNELDSVGLAKDEMLRASELASRRNLSSLERKYLNAVRSTIMQDFAGALSDYQAISGMLPRESKSDGLVDLGRAYEKTGDINQAIASYTSAAQLNSQDPAPFVRLGVLQGRRKRSAEAEAAFVQAERLYRASSNLEGIAEIAFQRGNDANTQLHLDEARKYLRESLDAARALNSPQLEIRALNRLTVTEYLAHNTDESIRLANQAIDLARENELNYWQIDGLIRLGNAYLSRGDDKQASAPLDRAMAMAQHGQFPRLIALAQSSLAYVRALQNKPDETIQLARSALKYYSAGAFMSESIEALTLIVRAERDQGNNQAALKSGQELLAVATRVDQPSAIMRAEESVGSVLLNLERYPEADKHFKQALSASRTLNAGVEYQLLHCANSAWRLGHYDDAERDLAAIPASARARPNFAALVDETRSEMLLSRNRYPAARVIVEKWVKDKSNPDPGSFERMMGQLETVSGSPARGQEWCRKALAQAQSEADPASAAAAELALANADLAAGSLQEAALHAETALKAFHTSDQKESEYLGLLVQAKIAFAEKDLAAAKDFSRKGIDIVSSFEHDYSIQEYKDYTSRPDVRDAMGGLRRLAQ